VGAAEDRNFNDSCISKAITCPHLNLTLGTKGLNDKRDKDYH